jgi:hypothetical protein
MKTKYSGSIDPKNSTGYQETRFSIFWQNKIIIGAENIKDIDSILLARFAATGSQ